LLERVLNRPSNSAGAAAGRNAQQLYVELAAAKARVAALEASLSWRISAPLRALGTAWLRVTGKV
jgi:hypothetical protein